MKSIKSVISEPVTDREEYHVMGFGLGTTENSRFVRNYNIPPFSRTPYKFKNYLLTKMFM